MPAHPHRCDVYAAVDETGNVLLHSPGLHTPETLLMAAVASCFVLVFRAMATASGVAWRRLDCLAEGVVDRVEGRARFSELHLQANLVLPTADDEDRAKRLLERAKAMCLASGSLAVDAMLTPTIAIVPGGSRG